MKLFLALITIFIVSSTTFFAQEEAFTFRAQVYYKNKPIKGAIVEVYNTGDLVYETVSRGGGKFQFDLKGEKEYMVEVSTPTTQLKTIWINTKNTKDVAVKIPSFSFSVHLKDVELSPYDELYEIPVTLIKYQSKKKEFYMDKAYANAVKSKKSKIKENTLQMR